AAVLAMTSADESTVGAVAGQLRSSLRIDNTDIGLLVTSTGAVGIITTLPFGWLADRSNRVRLLVASIVIWSGAMVASAAAQSFESLLLARLALGAVVAAAGPVVASLIGDLFAPAERGRIYGFILTGELLGAGFGLLVSGDVAAAWTWRASFGLLAVLGFALAVALGRLLDEPERGGRSRLPVRGQPLTDRLGNRACRRPKSGARELAGEVKRAKIKPVEGSLLRRDPGKQSLWWAVRAVLSVRTNVVLVAASSLGYFFYGGVQTFAVVFAKARFGLTQAQASLFLLIIGAGALLGLLFAGRLSDALLARHYVSARPAVATGCYLLAVALVLPGLLTKSLLIAVPALFLAAIGTGGANPALDAARLDVMPASLWGRAESVRTVLRTALQSSAPLVFGWVSTQLGARGSSGFGKPESAQPGHAAGLDHTFLIMLVPLLLATFLLGFAARRTYPRDVATALASTEVGGSRSG
ncbi:MAG TPA: MFS transporter, partial [Acidothermaceae bacterium]|nr:MFS transporter [Acidothermaceae bacterium]